MLLAAVAVLVLIVILILVVILVVILIVGLILISVLIVILVIHYRFLRHIFLRLDRYSSLPKESVFILIFEKQAGKKSGNDCCGYATGSRFQSAS